MKKLITFLFGSMMVVAVSAQTRQAQVIVHAPSNMEVRIDGINYSNGNNPTIPNLPQGVHALEVYEIKSNGILGIGKKKELVSSRNFTLGERDITITVDQYGQATISGEGRNGTDRRDGSVKQNRGRTDNTWAKGRNKDKSYDDDDDDVYENGKAKKAKKAKKSNGHGKKLGHYKNGKL
jgi:hypothetical protein